MVHGWVGVAVDTHRKGNLEPPTQNPTLVFPTLNKAEGKEA